MSTNIKNNVLKWITGIWRLSPIFGSSSQTALSSLEMTINEEDASRANFKKHLELREGKRNKVYLDSLGYPTVGVGHLVLKKDNLKVGDVISEDRIQAFLAADSAKAWEAAKVQARELSKGSDWAFIEALGAVNFQLGTGWTETFNKTYADLKAGKALSAIERIKASKWAKQTPVRTQDFIAAIEKAYKVSI